MLLGKTDALPHPRPIGVPIRRPDPFFRIECRALGRAELV